MTPRNKGLPLYQQIVDAIRDDLLGGRLKPGDPLPPVREMAERWSCTPGTVHQAYRELAHQNLVVSRAGQGTRIGTSSPSTAAELSMAALRRATLSNQAEAFILEVVAAGHTTAEVETAFRTALDRWRSMTDAAPPAEAAVLRFAGSHDPALSLLASRFETISPGWTMDVVFTGSLSGLIALAEDKADMAGSHLWDAETDSYNAAFVRRLLPGRRIALVTLAHRRLGLLVKPGNPLHIASLADVARPAVRYANRQPGTGTRVWLEAQLRNLGVDPTSLAGYEKEARTHGEVARAVAEDRADTGLGVETAALEAGLDFVPLAVEPYDLIVPMEAWLSLPVQALVGWLQEDSARHAIAALGGYDTSATGEVRWSS
jgi:molybdate-binding protein/DNA-binding transcriptional regulator YhcF (GntR family)